MTTSEYLPLPVDRASSEACLYRVAVCAFTYYAEKEDEEPGYTVTEDVDWCIAPLEPLSLELHVVMREEIETQITDPNADHQDFIELLRGLTDGGSQ